MRIDASTRQPWTRCLPGLAALCCVVVPALSFAATLQTASVVASPSASINVPVVISRSASEAVAAIQCDFVFDALRFSFVGAVASSALTAAGKQVQVSEISPGRHRVLAFGFNQNVIPAGHVFTLQLTAAPDAPNGGYLISPEGIILSDPNGSRIPTQGLSGTVTIGPVNHHSADVDENLIINLGELLRGIQLFNAGQYHCDASTEDGYAIGQGPQDCVPHSSDFQGTPNWRITLTELLRLIQLFNLNGYVPSITTEDGYEPVVAKHVD